MKASRLIFLIITIASLVSACDLSRSKSESHVAEGVGALNNGRASDAIRAFEAAVAADETNPNAWYYLGYTRLRGMNNPSGSIEALQTATELRPNDAEAPYQLAYALEQADRKDSAVTAYQTAAVRDPGHFGANLRLGQLQEETGQFRAAIDAYSNAIHADPSQEIAWLQLGNLYAGLGATDAAVAVFNNGIENIPDSGELRGALGVTLFEGDRLAEAIQSLELAIEQGQSSTPVTMTLGMAYLRRAETTGNSSDRSKAQEQFSRASRTCNPSTDGTRCAVIATQLHNLSQ